MLIKSLQKLGMISALMIMATNSNAALVSVSGIFTQFTVANGYLGFPTNINGSRISDGSLTTGIVAPLSSDLVTFDYGQVSNSFSFTGNTAEVNGTGPSNQFVLGKFTYTNGVFHRLAYIDFTLTTHSSEETLDQKTIQGRIRLESNPNGYNEPYQSADYFTVQGRLGNTLTALGSVRVFDYDYCPAHFTGPACNTGSVNIIGHINSLHLDSFANPTGGAFLNASVGSALVPIPTSILLFGSGLLGLLGIKRR